MSTHSLYWYQYIIDHAVDIDFETVYFELSWGLLFFLSHRPESAHLDKRLAESNRGHQLLRKMGEALGSWWVTSKQSSLNECGMSCLPVAGWEGAGLGTEEQGIQEPIKGGEVRDKQDKYKVQM